MPTPQNAAAHLISHEERAFFARLAAMNTLFEAARAGKAAQGYANRALASDDLLATFLAELKSN